MRRSQAAIGFKSTKKAILASDASTPRVLTTDSENLGKPGEKMRKKLGKDLANVAGEASGAGHFKHDVMLQQNEQDLLDVVYLNGFVPPRRGGRPRRRGGAPEAGGDLERRGGSDPVQPGQVDRPALPEEPGHAG